MAFIEHRKDISSWRVALLRITAFTNTPDVTVADNWWKAVAEEAPESKLVKMKGTALTMEGQHGTGRLTLNVEFNRVDWLFSPNVNLEQDFGEIPNLGSYEQVGSAFDKQIRNWIRVAPPITRVARGGVFFLPAADKGASYEALAQYLPYLKIDPKGSSELLYQINRARQSTVVPGLTINRLQKWSSMRVQHVQFEIVASAGQQVRGGATAPGFDATKLELDVNSSGERTEALPTESLESLYSELAHIETEILANGDIP
jgi:hypothetical protein